MTRRGSLNVEGPRAPVFDQALNRIGERPQQTNGAPSKRGASGETRHRRGMHAAENA
jgi:hypothetical protein